MTDSQKIMTGFLAGLVSGVILTVMLFWASTFTKKGKG